MPTIPPNLAGYRWSESVLQRLLTENGVVDREAVLSEATGHDDGNKYLKTSELRSAVDAFLARDPQPAGDAGKGYRWSPSVLARIMSASGIDDAGALISEATQHDDGNKYLKTSEIQAAADALGPSGETGVISDLDKTVIPPCHDTLPKTAIPGVATLLRELEFRNSGEAGDVYFVTARSADRVVDIPNWIDKQAVPQGPIDTGTSTLPWIAQPEKVADISRILDAHPDQKFVLFGDSSHRDPEVYTEVLAAYPDRIAAAFIHKVTHTVSPDRVDTLQLVENYAEAAAHLLAIGELDEPAARRVMQAAQREGLGISDSEIDQLLADNRP